MSGVVTFVEHSRRVGKSAYERNAMIAKLHIAKKQLALEEDSYRAVLQRITGKDSAADMSMGQLEAVLKEFKRLGFSGTPRTVKPGSKGGLPSESQAQKIRALWLNLYHLGALNDGAEEALLAYCRRMSGVAVIEWMHAEQFDNVIRGLRGWLQRLGWENPGAKTINGITFERTRLRLDANPSAANYGGIAAKAATIRAQYALLGLALDGFVPELMLADEMDDLIASLGERCRAKKKGAK